MLIYFDLLDRSQQWSLLNSVNKWKINYYYNLYIKKGIEYL